MNQLSPTFSRESFQTIDIGSVAVDLLRLHQLVLCRHGRIELFAGDGEASVLISKAELESLEQALEILSDTDEVRAMRYELARIAAVDAR